MPYVFSRCFLSRGLSRTRCRTYIANPAAKCTPNMVQSPGSSSNSAAAGPTSQLWRTARDHALTSNAISRRSLQRHPTSAVGHQNMIQYMGDVFNKLKKICSQGFGTFGYLSWARHLENAHNSRFVGRSWNAQKKRQMPFDSWWGADSKNVIFIKIGRWPFSKNALLCLTRYLFL